MRSWLSPSEVLMGVTVDLARWQSFAFGFVYWSAGVAWTPRYKDTLQLNMFFEQFFEHRNVFWILMYKDHMSLPVFNFVLLNASVCDNFVFCRNRKSHIQTYY